MKFVQVDLFAVNSSAETNDLLRMWQLQYPNRHIINLSLAPNEINYFLTIVYEVEVQ